MMYTVYIHGLTFFQIVIYTCGEKFRPHKKKAFKGHMVAGYACQVDFSPGNSSIKLRKYLRCLLVPLYFLCSETIKALFFARVV